MTGDRPHERDDAAAAPGRRRPGRPRGALRPLTDPRVRAHLPSGRRTSREQTAAGSRAQRGSWERAGLGCWTARLRDDVPAIDGLRPGAMVGVGGCAVREGTDWWNLYDRLARPAWGLGLAAELVTAALAAALA